MHNENWDDLRYILAVAELGSVSKAARSLGVNHATVLRRVANFENRHGASIFERTAKGYQVLVDKREVIDAAREAENAVRVVQNLVGGPPVEWHGTVRITSTETICQTFLPQIVAEIRAQTKQLNIELLSTNTHVDLARMQAGITIRPALELDDELVGEKATILHFAVFEARELSDENKERWIALSGPLSRTEPARWIHDNISPENLITASDSFFSLRQLAIVGMGRTFLPCFLGDQCAELVRSKSKAPQMQTPIWVASHTEFADIPSLRILRDQITTAISARSEMLRGSKQT